MDFSKDLSISENESSKYFVITAASVITLAAVVAFFCLCKDPGAPSALRWLLLISIISLIMRSYLCVYDLSLWDDGFALSFGMGLALSFFLCWFVSAVTKVPFGSILAFLSLISLSIIPYIIAYLKKRHSNSRLLEKVPVIAYIPDKRRINKFIWGLAIFALIYAIAFWVIGFNATLDSGTENYMDLGFMTSIYRQQSIAPFDMWFAGEKLNYYYLGQAAAVYLCRLSFVLPQYGYSLMLVTFWASVFTMSTEICYAVTKRFLPALIGGIASAFAGNTHWVVFGLFNYVRQFFNGEEIVDNYWFPDGTVYIRTDLGDLDNGKNEFPAYSAILGDLHAHVINIIFVLTLIALLIDYAAAKKPDDKKSNIILCGILLGLFKGTNYWDFAIYFVITGAVVVFCDIKAKGLSLKTIKAIVFKAFIVIILSYITILPFTLNFVKIASSVEICKNHTPINKFLLLWLVPILTTVVLIIWMYLPNNKWDYEGGLREGILAIALCTIGLVIVPELVYVKDIYGAGNERFNTMFKLTYQAFVLFGILAGIAAGLIGKYIGIIVVGIVILAHATYTPHAIKDWMGNVWDASMRKGISNYAGLYDDENYSYELLAAAMINGDTSKKINIIEGEGDSYTHSATLSVLTGACTVEGWLVHEWLWRDSYEIVSERAAEVRNFYESGDNNYCQNMIDKYDIDYIFVGPYERGRYNINDDGFAGIGQTVWQEYTDSGILRLIRVNGR